MNEPTDGRSSGAMSKIIYDQIVKDVQKSLEMATNDPGLTADGCLAAVKSALGDVIGPMPKGDDPGYSIEVHEPTEREKNERVLKVSLTITDPLLAESIRRAMEEG